MKRSVYLLLIILVPIFGHPQAQLVIDNAYINIYGGTSGTPVYVVTNNNAPSAISRTGGGIISEGEFNMVKWNIGTATAGNSFVVPFYYYSSSSYIPVTFYINTAGVGSGSVLFSTWHGSTATCNGGTLIADNYCYKPSDVTNMYPANSIVSYPGAASNDDSYYVVDRFWIVDANTGYTTKPSPILTFSYINTGGSSEIASPNVFSESTLIAQRFNSTAGKLTWGDYLGPSGTVTGIGTGIGTVSTSTAIAPGDFYRSWTLSDKNAPLPIQLTSFSAECDHTSALIKWTTASESNNNFFTIDKTQDGITYQSVTVVKGNGTTSSTHSYSSIDNNPFPGTSYYRISQTDFDGTTTIFHPVAFTACENMATTVSAFSANNTINITINANAIETYTLMLFNTLGQPILSKTINVSLGPNHIKLHPDISDGIYILRVQSERENYTKKLILGSGIQ